MTNNIVGIKHSNVIVPYTGATKKTKTIAMTSADVSSPSLNNLVFKAGNIICSCDSTGKWRAEGGLTFMADFPSATEWYIVLPRLKFSNADSTYNQPIEVIILNSPSIVPYSAVVFPNGSAISFKVLSSASDTGVYVQIKFDVFLEEEPTAYTIPANMEGVTAVDVLIENASTVPGLLSYYETGSVAANNNFTGGTIYYTRIGNLVQISTTVLTHASSAGAITSGGPIPASLRPAGDRIPGGIYWANAASIRRAYVDANGNLEVTYYDYAGNGYDDTGTAVGVNFSYLV